MRSEFENSIKRSASYEKLVYQHGERLFIFDDGKYKIAAVQLAWELEQHNQSRVDELQKRVDSTLKVVQSMRNEVKHGHLSDEEVQMLSSFADELEQALKGGLDE